MLGPWPKFNPNRIALGTKVSKHVSKTIYFFVSHANALLVGTAVIKRGNIQVYWYKTIGQGAELHMVGKKHANICIPKGKIIFLLHLRSNLVKAGAEKRLGRKPAISTDNGTVELRSLLEFIHVGEVGMSTGKAAQPEREKVFVGKGLLRATCSTIRLGNILEGFAAINDTTDEIDTSHSSNRFIGLNHIDFLHSLFTLRVLKFT